MSIKYHNPYSKFSWVPVISPLYKFNTIQYVLIKGQNKLKNFKRKYYFQIHIIWNIVLFLYFYSYFSINKFITGTLLFLV